MRLQLDVTVSKQFKASVARLSSVRRSRVEYAAGSEMNHEAAAWGTDKLIVWCLSNPSLCCSIRDSHSMIFAMFGTSWLLTRRITVNTSRCLDASGLAYLTHPIATAVLLAVWVSRFPHTSAYGSVQIETQTTGIMR